MYGRMWEAFVFRLCDKMYGRKSFTPGKLKLLVLKSQWEFWATLFKSRIFPNSPTKILRQKWLRCSLKFPWNFFLKFTYKALDFHIRFELWKYMGQCIYWIAVHTSRTSYTFTSTYTLNKFDSPLYSACK